jgi:hypothetical protein
MDLISTSYSRHHSSRSLFRAGKVGVKAEPHQQILVPGSGFRVWGLGFGVWGLGFGVWGLGFGVWGLEFTVLGFGFKV